MVVVVVATAAARRRDEAIVAIVIRSVEWGESRLEEEGSIVYNEGTVTSGQQAAEWSRAARPSTVGRWAIIQPCPHKARMFG